MEDQRIIIGDTDDATISYDHAQKIIDMAEAYVNMRLAKKYTIPFIAPASSSQVVETIEWNYIKGIIANKFAFFLYNSTYSANIPNRSEYAETYNNIAEDMILKLLGDDPEITLTTQTFTEAGIAETEDAPASNIFDRSLNETFSMTGTGELSYTFLLYSAIKPYSEIIQNSTKTTTYTRGTDYDIDYIEGRIWRITGGTIPESTSLYATYWYGKEDPFAITPVRHETDAYKEN
jgi:hypothetical protein